jgi:hypothetical protein
MSMYFCSDCRDVKFNNVQLDSVCAPEERSAAVLVQDITAHGLQAPNDDKVVRNADDGIGRVEANGAECGPRRLRCRRW